MKRLSALLLILTLALSGCASAPDQSLPSATPAIAPSQPSTPGPSPTSRPSPSPTPAPDPIQEQLDELTTAQKVGQLLLAGIEGTQAGEDAAYAVQTVQAGGVILFGRNVDTCAQVAQLVTDLRAMNGDYIPLLIASDEEGGSVSRMPEEVHDLPAAYAFGQTGDEGLCRALGKTLAAQCAALGINVDFAPVADVWSNPDNTVIGRRALGSDSADVARLVSQMMEGLAEGGVVPVLKHFPGHGDTNADSHYDLPVVNKSLDELEQLELPPFAAAIAAGAPAVMVGHLLMLDLDDTLPASLSPAVVTDLLRERMGFDGVVFTDDLTMGAVSNTYGMGESAVLAVEAGCDVLLVCHGRDNLQAAYEALLDAVDSGRISPQRLNESVYRILTLKGEFDLNSAWVPAPDVDQLNAQLDELLAALDAAEA